MARVSWFDEETDLPIIHEQARNLESFVEAMADGQVERRELEHQQERLIAAMKGVERELSDVQHEKVTRLLLELSAYNIMRLLHELQAERIRAFTTSRQ
jgi:predicted transcriptional regulator